MRGHVKELQRPPRARHRRRPAGQPCGCAACARPLPAPPPMSRYQASVLNRDYAEERADYRLRHPHRPLDQCDLWADVRDYPGQPPPTPK